MGLALPIRTSPINIISNNTAPPITIARHLLDRSMRLSAVDPIRVQGPSRRAAQIVIGRKVLNIEDSIKSFKGDGNPERRSASFDYCFNYFQAFREEGNAAKIAAKKNMLLSCLHLGFYLASWGMFRGSSGLRSRSLKQFEPVVNLIARTPGYVWAIDAHCYSEEARQSVVTTANQIQEALHGPDGAWPTKTVATKIMLGVFGNVPAFDSRVVAGLRKARLTGRFGYRALRDIGRFYHDHQEIIDSHRDFTLDFASGQPTRRRYTRAKVIDEIFYIEGK
jgi:hypothetical protein